MGNLPSQNAFLDIYKYFLKQPWWSKALLIIIFFLLIGPPWLSVLKPTSTINNNIGEVKDSDSKLATKEVSPVKDIKGESQSKDFNKFIVDKNVFTDSEGYFCPDKEGFDYWGIWTESKIGALFDLKARLQVKTDSPLADVPIIAFTYGEYREGLAPINDYRFSFFEGELKKAIRLYDSSNESLGQYYLTDLPAFGKDLVISFSSKIVDEDSNIVFLVPEVEYIPIGSSSPVKIKPDKEFRVPIESVDIADQSFARQIGILINPGYCFKIFSLDIN